MLLFARPRAHIVAVATFVIANLPACSGTDDVSFPESAKGSASPNVISSSGGRSDGGAPRGSAGAPGEPAVEARDAAVDARDELAMTDAKPNALTPDASLGCRDWTRPPFDAACTTLAWSPLRVSASAQIANKGPFNAFDHDTCTAWLAGSAPPQWLKFELCSSDHLRDGRAD